jgi:hypothetical protein
MGFGKVETHRVNVFEGTDTDVRDRNLFYVVGSMDFLWDDHGSIQKFRAGLGSRRT